MFKLDKSAARKNFDGSERLFNAVCSKYLKLLSSDIDNPTDQTDVDGWLETIAADFVNRPSSSFYIYGK